MAEIEFRYGPLAWIERVHGLHVIQERDADSLFVTPSFCWNQLPQEVIADSRRNTRFGLKKALDGIRQKTLVAQKVYGHFLPGFRVVPAIMILKVRKGPSHQCVDLNGAV